MSAAWVDWLAEWSLRFAALVVPLMLWLALRPPRAVAARLWLLRLALVGGLLLPLAPRWWAAPELPAAPAAVEVPPAPVEVTPSEVAPARLAPVEVTAPTRSPAVEVVSPEPRAVRVPDALAAPEFLPPEVSPPAPFDWRRLIAVLWLAGCGACLIRLAGGLWWLGRVRRGSRALSDDLAREVGAARRELGVRRRVDLLESASVAAPALLGGVRPAVVVPPGWGNWPAPDRRAALLHELAHVKGGDDWASLAEEVVRAVFFFHPPVRWLLGRLAREREARCDLAAVRSGVAPRELARVLFEAAARAAPGRVPARALIPMARRNSVAGRIHTLLEPDMTRVSRPLSWPRAAASASAVFALCAAVGGYGDAAQKPTIKLVEPENPAAEAAKSEKPAGVRGTVTLPGGKPAAGATVVVAADVGAGARLTTTADAKGEFVFDALPKSESAFPHCQVVAVLEGHAPASAYATPGGPDVALELPAAGSFAGVVRDTAGKPVAGAELLVGFVRRSGNGASWGYENEKLLRGTALDRFYATKSGADGSFRFDAVPAGGELILRVSAAGLAELDTGAGGPKAGRHVVKPDAKPAELVMRPEAVVRGTLASKVPGVAPESITVKLDGTDTLHGFHRTAKPDAQGRFTAAGLPAGKMGVSVELPPGAAMTAAGVSVEAEENQTREVALELVPGVEVTGRIVLRGTGEPVGGARVATLGLVSPHSFAFPAKPSGPDGRFTMRLPVGKVTLLTWALPAGLSDPAGTRRKEVEVPAGVATFELPKPFELVKVARELAGRVTDAAGKPLPHAKVSALQLSSVCGNFATEPATASSDGSFTLPYSPNGPLEAGRSVPLRVELEDGRRFEAAALLRADGAAEVRVPTLPDVPGPADVKPNELAGVVVDAAGKPLAGVTAHAHHWVDDPTNKCVTGADGVFRIPDCDPKRSVEIRFTKADHSPVMIAWQQVGMKGLVVVMDAATYFEGLVRGPDGKPAGGAIIRADQGPKRLDGMFVPACWTETTADAEGKYRLYVQPDEYEFHVTAPGVGVARLSRTGIGHGQARAYDIALKPAIAFRAKVVDSITGAPAAGVRLYDWAQKRIGATSDANGELTVPDMLPGPFSFQVKSDAHARWWSEQAVNPWQRKTLDDRRPELKWQRNFDDLTFDLKQGMETVTITVERAVTVRGRVVDPDGKPVGGATAAPALTGTGNSLTGDTRFSTETKPDGTFTMTLPASHAAKYNLVAHDGKYQEWRNWANGVLPPISTAPGQVIEGVTLTLTRGGAVRGVVVDAQGEPVAGREVRASAADRLENRYYDPTTSVTKPDGTFELKFVRPGKQHIQVEPFWLDADEAPAGTSVAIELKPGQVAEGVRLVAAPEPAK